MAIFLGYLASGISRILSSRGSGWRDRRGNVGRLGCEESVCGLHNKVVGSSDCVTWNGEQWLKNGALI